MKPSEIFEGENSSLRKALDEAMVFSGEYSKIDHSHCWNQKNAACGQKIKHFECCLCKELHPEITQREVGKHVMKIERTWAMPSMHTFTIKPIRELLVEEVIGGIWCDPFAGMNSPAQVTNDLRPDMPTTHHLPALEFLKLQADESFDGVLYDPPYSPRQVKECYDNIDIAGWDKKWDGRTTFWSETLDECVRILKPSGKLIAFGWTSMGGGKSRGLQMERILLVPHGGRKNDTIVTVETKLLPTPVTNNQGKKI